MNIFVILVSTSRYWFNYRHFANTLSIYTILKRIGLPKRNIILINANNSPCDPRNPFLGTIFSDPNYVNSNFYDADFETYIKDNDVNPNLVNTILSGSKNYFRPNSKVLFYITGHGGDEFIKFHDNFEFSATDLSISLHQLHSKLRYEKLILVTDTCQASTLTSLIESPSIITLASSRKGENSYAHETNKILGLSLMDRFTHSFYHYLSRIYGEDKSSKLKYMPDKTLNGLLNHLDPAFLFSTPSFNHSANLNSKIVLKENFDEILRPDSSVQLFSPTILRHNFDEQFTQESPSAEHFDWDKISSSESIEFLPLSNYPKSDSWENYSSSSSFISSLLLTAIIVTNFSLRGMRKL